MNKSKQSSPLIAALLPGGALLVLYAAYCMLFPSQQVKDIAALSTKLQTLVAQEIPAAARLQLAGETEAANEKLQAKKGELDALRAAAGTLLQGQISGVEQLQSKRRINEALRAAGLTSVAHTAIENREPKITKSLDTAAKKLSDTLNAMASKDASNETIALPPDLPRDVNPLEWMEEQRRLRAAKFDRVKGQVSELQLVGDYRAMLAGLAELKRSCPEAMVSSIAFEKSKRRTAATTQLIWKVRLQLQAPPTEASPDGEVIAHRTAKVPVTVAASRRDE